MMLLRDKVRAQGDQRSRSGEERGDEGCDIEISEGTRVVDGWRSQKCPTVPVAKDCDRGPGASPKAVVISRSPKNPPQLVSCSGHEVWETAVQRTATGDSNGYSRRAQLNISKYVTSLESFAIAGVVSGQPEQSKNPFAGPLLSLHHHQLIPAWTRL